MIDWSREGDSLKDVQEIQISRNTYKNLAFDLIISHYSLPDCHSHVIVCNRDCLQTQTHNVCRTSIVSNDSQSFQKRNLIVYMNGGEMQS